MKPLDVEQQTPLVGLTGSIGSGKSEVSKIFRSLGCNVIDADLLAREAVRPNTEAFQKIVQEFGPSILAGPSEIDRAKLSEVIFSNPAKKEILENIIHPQVRLLFSQQLQLLRKSPESLGAIVLYVVPLLFESKYSYDELDAIIVVSAPQELCIERIVSRDGCSAETAKLKYDSQLPLAEKEKLADYIIYNSSDFEDLEKATQDVFTRIVNKK